MNAQPHDVLVGSCWLLLLIKNNSGFERGVVESLLIFPGALESADIASGIGHHCGSSPVVKVRCEMPGDAGTVLKSTSEVPIRELQ